MNTTPTATTSTLTTTTDRWSALSRTGSSAPANADVAASTSTSTATRTGQDPAVVIDLSDAAKAGPQGTAATALQSLDLPKSFDEMVQRRTQALADKLTRSFAEAGIDVRDALDLKVDSAGMIRTDGPYKERIEQFFRDNPDIAEEFRDVASLNTMKATMEALRLYNEEMKSARTEEAQAEVRDRFTTRSIRIQELAGSLTLEDGGLTSAAVEYADALSPAGDKPQSLGRTDLLA